MLINMTTLKLNNKFKHKLKYSVILVVLAVFMTGCVANKEMEQVVDHLSQTNAEAKKIIKSLSVKDKILTELANDRNIQIKRLMTVEVNTLHHAALASLRLQVIETRQAIYQHFFKTKKACFATIDKELKNINLLAEQAEKQALLLYQESKKFPQDKTLELQAAKAAADYFGQLFKTNTMAFDAKENCQTQLNVALEGANKAIDAARNKEEDELEHVKKMMKQQVSADKFIIIMSSQTSFDALIDWVNENELVYSNTITYLKTNNFLSSEGIPASFIKSLGNSVLAVAVGANVDIPSKDDIKRSGENLVNTLTANAKADFDQASSDAKNVFTEIKTGFTGKLDRIIQGSSEKILRKLTETILN